LQGAVGGDTLVERAERVAVADEDQRGTGDRAKVVDGVPAGLADSLESPGENLFPVARTLGRVVVSLHELGH